MVIQHLGGSGFDLDGLGIGLHERFRKFSKEKGYPSSHTGWHTAWNKPCLKPWMSKGVIFDTQCEPRLGPWLSISHASSRG